MSRTPVHRSAANETLVGRMTPDDDPAPERSPSPARIGRFDVRGEIGRGGMGRVYAAVDPLLNREVAIKVLHDRHRVSTAWLQRFTAEAQLTSQLPHPNIVPVHELGVDEHGDVWFAMKRVQGRSLREVLVAVARGEPADVAHWTLRRLLGAFVQVGQAMAYAHGRGVLHRDLKPENIMLGEFGEVLVMDWGLARLLAAAAGGPGTRPLPTLSYSLDGGSIGTPGYMSPEQADGLVPDGRSDVFSLGAILYEMLTLRPAWTGESNPAVLAATRAGPPIDPRKRAPDRLIPEEIAQVCMDALALDRERRIPSAAELVRRVERFLEGAQRRDRALAQLDEARSWWTRFLDLGEQSRALQAQESALAATVRSWAPVADKADLYRLRDDIDATAVALATTFARVIACGERALSHDPGNAEARAFLARAYWSRFEAAETARDAEAQAFYADRVQEYDDGPFAERLRGDGAITLETEPAGAVVLLERLEPHGLAWTWAPPERLGVTPLHAVRLPMGSYRLRLQYPGRRDTLYPVHITRGLHWDAGDAPVRLLTDAEIGPDFLYVPGGPFLGGGDPAAGRPLPAGRYEVGPFLASRFPVTAGEYLAFLDALHAEGGDALRHVPRSAPTLSDPGRPCWSVPDGPDGRFSLPEVDPDGAAWRPDWPVLAVSWADARAYAAWRSRRDGVVYDLPTELEWEKVARGVDGRLFPWGNRFDPAACRMEHSQPGPLTPGPVGGYPLDVSPYGVQDLAGCIREWCGDEAFDGDPGRRPVRGGAWSTSERLCRAATRFGFKPDALHTYIGFRLVRRL